MKVSFAILALLAVAQAAPLASAPGEASVAVAAPSGSNAPSVSVVVQGVPVPTEEINTAIDSALKGVQGLNPAVIPDVQKLVGSLVNGQVPDVSSFLHIIGQPRPQIDAIFNGVNGVLSQQAPGAQQATVGLDKLLGNGLSAILGVGSLIPRDNSGVFITGTPIRGNQASGGQGGANGPLSSVLGGLGLPGNILPQVTGVVSGILNPLLGGLLGGGSGSNGSNGGNSGLLGGLLGGGGNGGLLGGLLGGGQQQRPPTQAVRPPTVSGRPVQAGQQQQQQASRPNGSQSSGGLLGGLTNLLPFKLPIKREDAPAASAPAPAPSAAPVPAPTGPINLNNYKQELETQLGSIGLGNNEITSIIGSVESLVGGFVAPILGNLLGGGH